MKPNEIADILQELRGCMYWDAEAADWRFDDDVLNPIAPIEAAIAHLRAAGNGAAAVPEGWKLVPEVPTPEMLEAADLEGLLSPRQAREHWDGMLAAAPAANAQPAEPVAQAAQQPTTQAVADTLMRAGHTPEEAQRLAWEQEDRDHTIYLLWEQEKKGDGFRDRVEELVSHDYFRAGYLVAHPAAEQAAAAGGIAAADRSSDSSDAFLKSKPCGLNAKNPAPTTSTLRDLIGSESVLRYSLIRMGWLSPEDAEALRKSPISRAPVPAAGLTDEQISELWSWSMTADAERTATTQQHAFARAILAAAKGGKQ